jgi:hypothetical protein
MNPEQNIALTMINELKKNLSNALLEKAAVAMGKEAVKIIQERTMQDELDYKGRKFGEYNARTYKTKSGRRKMAKKQYIQIKRDKYDSSTYLWNTGALMSSIYATKPTVTLSANIITIKFKLTVRADQMEKAEGLMSTTGVARNHKTYSKKAWRFLGIAESGPLYQSERNRLLKVFFNHLGTGKGKASITAKH